MNINSTNFEKSNGLIPPNERNRGVIPRFPAVMFHRAMNKFFILVFLIVIVAPTYAETLSHRQVWIAIIQEYVGIECKLLDPIVGRVVSGNDGSRQEEWDIDTCKGKLKFIVTFKPKSDFPKKVIEYGVAEVKTKHNKASQPTKREKRA